MSDGMYVTQVVVEAASSGDVGLRATQVAAEAASRGEAGLRASQVVGEVLSAGQAAIRLSQVVVEIVSRRQGIRVYGVRLAEVGAGIGVSGAAMVDTALLAAGTYVQGVRLAE